MSKTPECVCDLFVSKHLISESDFFTIGPLYLYPVWKTFCNFSLQLNMTNSRCAFLVLLFWKKKKVLN